MSDPDDIDSLDAELIKQFPKPPSPVPNLEMSEVPDDLYYPDGPPQIVTIPLSKAKYTNRLVALMRARELCTLRGLKFLRLFDTRRDWVAHTYRASDIPVPR